MTSHSPSAWDLTERPELSVLHLLDATLVIAQSALLAAHPALDEVDCSPQAPPLDPDAWLADAIVTHIAGLQTALRRYRAELSRQRASPLVQRVDF